MMYDKDETYEWAQRLIDGDEEAIEVLALRYQNMVIGAATTEVEKYQDMYTTCEREDVIAEGNYALVKALNEACGTDKLAKNTYISTFLKMEIHNRIKRLRERLHFIRVPMATLMRKRANGESIDVPKRASGCITDLQLDRSTNNYYPSLIDDVDLEQMEREVLEQRLMNQATITELAEHYGISAYKITQTYKQALKKVRQTIEGDEDGTL